MLELNRIEDKALERYFTHLTNYGYVNNKKLTSLLVLIFLEEALTKYFTDFITEKDYNAIRRLVENLSNGNCLIDSYKYFTGDSIFHESLNIPIVRLSTSNIIRTSEAGEIRYVDE